MNYAPKGGVRDKRMRGHCNMKGRQDNFVVILVVVRLSPTLFVWRAYDSRHLVDLSLPASLRLAEDEYRMGC